MEIIKVDNNTIRITKDSSVTYEHLISRKKAIEQQQGANNARIARINARLGLELEEINTLLAFCEEFGVGNQ